jgi:hypothetical protein
MHRNSSGQWFSKDGSLTTMLTSTRKVLDMQILALHHRTNESGPVRTQPRHLFEQVLEEALMLAVKNHSFG